MLYSNACTYAVRALARLAHERPDGYLLMDELCADTSLPRHFVAKIFQGLVRDGLLHSAKGRGGGFALAHKPQDITLAEIVAAVDGPDVLDDVEVGITDEDHPILPKWATLGTRVRAYLEKTTLKQIADQL